MVGVTYEQLVSICDRWGYSVGDGYRAMCLTANVIDTAYGNAVDKLKAAPISDLAISQKKDVELLCVLYSRLDSEVFDMLEKEDCE